MIRETIKTADSIVHVETTTKVSKRVLDYADILEACTIEYDEDSYDPPWEDYDGFEHELIRSYSDGEENGQGYISYGHNRGYTVTIDDDTVVNKWGITRQAGESKQVWRERVAAVKQSTIEQLVKWYENGWEYFGCVCRIKVTEDGIESTDWKHADYQASCWRIDSEEYAEEVKPDIAAEIVAELEDDGYIVENQPEPRNAKEWKKQCLRERIKRQLAG